MGWSAFEASGVVGMERGDGDALAVVLHGGPGLNDYTEGLADEVFEAGDGGLRVVRYQQRGQRPSTTDGPLSIAQLVDDCVAVIDHFGADRALVIGHSWGGHLAMHVGLARPERVRALVIIDSLGAVGDGGTGTMGPVIGGRIGPAAVAELEALPTRGLTPDEEGAESMRIRWPGYFSDPAAAPPAPPLEVSATARDAFLLDALRMMGEGVLERGLPTLDIPSLHLVARHSPIEPAANEKTAALMRGAVVEINDTGHFAWIEQPGSIATAVRRFLAALR